MNQPETIDFKPESTNYKTCQPNPKSNGIYNHSSQEHIMFLERFCTGSKSEHFNYVTNSLKYNNAIVRNLRLNCWNMNSLKQGNQNSSDFCNSPSTTLNQLG